MADTLIWPENLGCPVRAGYKIDPETGVIRTPMDLGIARARRRFEKAPHSVAATWMMTGEQLRYFWAWIEQKASYGAAWFKIDLDFGLGRQTVDARITAAPSIERVSTRRWRVGLALEVLPGFIEDIDYLDLIGIAGGVETLEAMSTTLSTLAIDETALFDTGFDDWAAAFGV